MKNKKTIRVMMVITFILTVSFGVFAQQQERIIRFHSDIKIDAELSVRISIAREVRYANLGEIPLLLYLLLESHPAMI